jgi:hypothetical protein
MLDISRESGVPVFNRHYCYYESLVYLRESIVSWLDGNVLAATTLLRPFMELAVLHLYWYSRSRIEGYGPYYEWLAGNIAKPPFRNQVDYIFDHLPIKACFDEGELDTVRSSLTEIYRWGCIYNHTPKVEESLFHIARGSGAKGRTRQDLVVALAYYPLVCAPLLQEVLCTFLLAYPMALFPVERYAKWGFASGPVGTFIDITDGTILREALGRKRFEAIKSKVKHSSEIKEKLDWFAEEPNLSEEELGNSWSDFQRSNNVDLSHMDARMANSWAARVSMTKSCLRALGWAMNYMEDPPNVEDLDFTL